MKPTSRMFWSALILFAATIGWGTELATASPVGNWYAKVSEFATTDHFLIVRSSDGQFEATMMSVDHKNKKYAFEKDSGAWSISGSTFTEKSKSGSEVKFSVKQLSDSVFEYLVRFDGGRENVVKEQKTSTKKLPDPPPGYQKVTLDQFYQGV